MKLTIDRFEGNIAVCEGEERRMINIEIQKLPYGVKEGDVLKIEGDKIIIDAVETQKRRKEIEKFTKNLWE